MGSVRALALVLLIAAAAAAYDNCMVLSSTDEIQLSWTIVNNVSINVGVSAKLGGYLALGLYPLGGPQPHVPGIIADLWILARPGSGCRDCLAGAGCLIDGQLNVKVVTRDGTRSITAVQVSSANGYLIGNFSRLLNTGDANDRVIDINQDMDIIWGCHHVNDVEDDCSVGGHEVQGGTPPTGCLGQRRVSFGKVSSCTPAAAGNGTFSSPSGDFKLTFDKLADGTGMQFSMEATTTGWVSFGFAVEGTLPHSSSDMYVGFVAGGSTTLIDSWSNTKAQPSSDGTQNAIVVSGTETAGKTTITFTRSFDTGDAANDLIISDRTYVLQWAYGSVDVLSAKHVATGIANINFLSGQSVTTTPPPQAPPPKAEGGVFTSPNGDFSLKFERSPNGEGFKFTAEAQTTGWVAFGWSDGTPAHVDTDMCVGRVIGSNTEVFDTWSTSEVLPALDTSQDFELVSGTEAGGRTTFVVLRKLDTGQTDDLKIENKEYLLQWAYGTDDGGQSNSYSQHSSDARGTAKINFFSGASNAFVLELTAGILLCMIVAAMISVWIVMHYVYKIHKKRMRMQTEQILRSQRKRRGADAHIFHHEATPISNLSSQQSYGADVAVRGQQSFGRANRQTVFFRGGTAVYVDREEDFYGYDEANDDGYGHEYTTADDGYGAIPLFSQAGNGQRHADVEMRAVSRPNKRMSLIQAPAPAMSDISGPVASATNVSGHDAKQLSTGIALLWYKFSHSRIPKTQISVLDVVCAVAFLGLNVLSMVFAPPASAQSDDGWTTKALADVTGSLTGGNALLVVVPATRNSILAWLLGIPFDRMIMFHRWLGRWLGILCTVHMALFFTLWDKEDSGTKIANELGGENDIGSTRLLGLFGWLALVLMLISSYSWIRRNQFNTFFFAHFLFFAFYAFGAFHVPQTWPFVFASAAWYGLDRVVRFMWGAWPRRAEISLKPNEVTRVRFPKHFLARYRVGQYVFLNLPQLSLLEWHPFTLSSSPLEDFCEVHIKRLGDYTGKLQELAGSAHRLWVRVDGPYGKFSLNYKRYPIVCLLGGGIGVTPLIAMLKSIYRVNISAKTERKAKMSPVVRAVYFVWSCPTESVYQWFQEEIAAAQAMADASDDFPTLHLFVHVTRQKVEELSPAAQGTLLCSRPDIKAVWKQMAADESGSRVATFACGPAPLIDSGWDESIKQSKKSGKRFDFHHETFDF